MGKKFSKYDYGEIKYENLQGENIYGYFKKVPNYDWIIVSKVNYKIITQDLILSV